MVHASVFVSTADGYGSAGSAQTGDDGGYQLPHVYPRSCKLTELLSGRTDQAVSMLRQAFNQIRH